MASVLNPAAIADQAIKTSPNPPENKPGEETVFPKPAVESTTEPAKAKGSNKDSKVVSPESIPVSQVPDQVGIIETTRGGMVDIERWKEQPKKAHPKIGLALGGGGARGAAHVPVIRALEKEGIKFDYIAGTSIGAVVGGLYAAGVSLDDLENEFENGRIMKNFMTVSLAVRIAVAPVLYLPRILGSKEYDGLYKGNKFRKYLVRGLSCHDMNIEDLKIPFAAISLNLLDGKPYMIRKGNLGFAMQASSAVPGLRKPVEIGDYLFVDGGTLVNLPVKQVREMGADFVIAVNIDQPFALAKKEHFRKPGSVATRMLNWDLWDMDRPQAGLADITIHPNTESVSLISTKKADAKKCSRAGEAAVQEALPALREMLKNYGIATTSAQ
ncbi:MAG: patatin-like phospholipase family protein [Candidatus Melainabacteria bacterium]|nr:patatin-like phospholipase family protein [Candidatus Melainabacteria bacterium]